MGQDRLNALAAELGTDRALAVVTDVTQQDDVLAMVRAGAARFGGIDVLVSNAGLGAVKEFEETTLADWRQVMGTDVDSCFFGAQAALPYLKESRGSIVQIARPPASAATGGSPPTTRPRARS
jgi:meso-butanediol dehydrogenase/(S,S)-butanediol dehydrogenase/diacetyl reductase